MSEPIDLLHPVPWTTNPEVLIDYIKAAQGDFYVGFGPHLVRAYKNSLMAEIAMLAGCDFQIETRPHGSFFVRIRPTDEATTFPRSSWGENLG